jgi:hypothetical protein
MFAIGRGSGVARRFESVPVVANEPSDISILKPGKTAAKNFRLKNTSSLSSAGARHAIGYRELDEHFDRVCAERITPNLVRR